LDIHIQGKVKKIVFYQRGWENAQK
jgi:hypothetical protein